MSESSKLHSTPLDADRKRILETIVYQNPLETARNTNERLSGNGRNLFEMNVTDRLNQIERGHTLTAVAALALAFEIKAAEIAFCGWAKHCGCRLRVGKSVEVRSSDTTAEIFRQ